MFESVADVVRALRRFGDLYGSPSRPFVGALRRGVNVDADPFRRGFLAAVEEREYLSRRLAALPDRERAIVVLWYVADLPVAEICEKLSLSRAHCYRLRDRALRGMLSARSVEAAEATA